MKYITANRIRWWVSAFFQIALFAAVFLPGVRIIAIAESDANVEIVTQSALWYISQAGFPVIYATILTVYGLLSLPVLVFGFKKLLKPASLMVAAVTDIIYLIVNVLWTVFVYALAITGDFATTANFTIWFWLYVVLQAAQIVHLFMLFFKIKKAR
ncbi:MAG: hypothetical protein J6Q74_03560, partial [Clostridia bacterium]|nr:hypothetical protein [Clostridia bacterium]